MTGEVSLTGRVLPIGGVKQKLLAAHRAGITTVLIPQRNEPDLDDVPGRGARAADGAPGQRRPRGARPGPRAGHGRRARRGLTRHDSRRTTLLRTPGVLRSAVLATLRRMRPLTTALVTVDLMERIVAQPLGPRPGSEVLARSIELADAFRTAGATVVAIRVERPNVTEQPPGSGFAEGILADLEIVKRSIGAFATSDLHEQLQGRGIDTLVLTGIATNLGVESTARAAADLGYDLVFVEDAMTALTTDEHDATVRYNFPRLGTVLTAAEVLTALASEEVA